MSSQKNFHVDKACDIFSYAKMLEFQKENNIINMKEKQEKKYNLLQLSKGIMAHSLSWEDGKLFFECK